MWFKRYRERLVLLRIAEANATSVQPIEMLLVGNMFLIVDGMLFRPWEEVEKVLEAHHQVLTRMDLRWT